tara:strand:- start:117 stop:482 length:366 start_codon:yes stop_codon:yes gene_type:complete
MAKKIDETNILLENIIDAIQDAKGIEIVSLDLKSLDSAISKYFVICTGTSNTHVNAIEGNIKKTISKYLGEKPLHTEGNRIGEWILMDYIDIIVHIFQEKTRAFYNIEDFWADAKFKKHKD